MPAPSRGDNTLQPGSEVLHMYVNEQTKSSFCYTIKFSHLHGNIMKMKSAMTCVVCATLLGSAAAMAADDSTSDTAHAMVFVKDSAITTEIKSKLAAEHITSLERIHVDTDKDGVVWLSGTASTRKAADKAASIARDTEHVKDVHSDITVKSAS
jgi:hyperosmotically inducible protein